MTSQTSDMLACPPPRPYHSMLTSITSTPALIPHIAMSQPPLSMPMPMLTQCPCPQENFWTNGLFFGGITEHGTGEPFIWVFEAEYPGPYTWDGTLWEGLADKVTHMKRAGCSRVDWLPSMDLYLFLSAMWLKLHFKPSRSMITPPSPTQSLWKVNPLHIQFKLQQQQQQC